MSACSEYEKNIIVATSFDTIPPVVQSLDGSEVFSTRIIYKKYMDLIDKNKILLELLNGITEAAQFQLDVNKQESIRLRLARIKAHNYLKMKN